MKTLAQITVIFDSPNAHRIREFARAPIGYHSNELATRSIVAVIKCKKAIKI